MRLFVIDLDGVIFDPSHRAHLVPDTHGHNKHWELHQAPEQVALDPVLEHNVNLIRGMINLETDQIVFLSSRASSNYQVTVERLRKLFPEFRALWRYTCRDTDDHRPPAVFKTSVMHCILDLYNPDVVYFIEDTISNCNEVLRYFPKIIPVVFYKCPT